MLKIGITGGIGSGKSTICRIFEVMGIPVYYADDRAKWLMNHLPELKAEIIKEFGEETYNEKGLDRAYLAKIVFKNKERLKALEALVHPQVFKDGERWYKEHSNSPYTLRENALMFETGSYKQMDKTITVFAPVDIRIQRVMARDNTTKEAIEARMSKQMPEDEKLKLADFVIKNDNKTSLIRQVYRLHEIFQSMNQNNHGI